MAKRIRSGFGAGAAALLILLCQSAQVFGYAEYYTYGDYNPTSSSNPGYYREYNDSAARVSFSRPVGDMLSIGDNKSYATSSGYADAGKLRMGISASAVSRPQNNYFTSSYIATTATNRATILPGTSGLSAGDTTRLQLTMKLDGTLGADARSYPGKGWVHAEFDAGFAISDSSVTICGPGEVGCWSPQLAFFGASGEAEAYDVYGPGWGYNYSNHWSESWSYGSNITPETSHDLAGGTKEQGVGMYYDWGRSFDTGYLTLVFEAIVGHTLDIESYLEAYVDANNDAESFADFDKTLAFGLTPTNGVVLGWEIGNPVPPAENAVPPGPEAVPEPSSMLLVGAGLVSLLGLHRVRARKEQ